MSRRNDVRETLEAGGTVLGTRASTFSPALVEVYADLGVDFVWLDFEHTGHSDYDSTTLEHLARTAEAAGVDLLVRLHAGEPSLVRKVLDTGVRSVVVPRVETAADARRAAAASRFAYDGGVGGRGVAHGRSSRWGGDVNADGEDATVLVGAMLESAAAVENVEEILAVPGIGFAYLGPGDLAVSLGRAVETDHPEVQDAIGTVRRACLDAGVPLGRSVTTATDAREALADGYRLVRVGDELSAVRQQIGGTLDTVRGA